MASTPQDSAQTNGTFEARQEAFRLVSTRRLSRHTGIVLDELLENRRSALVTSHGDVVAIIVPIDSSRAVTYVADHVEEIKLRHEEARKEHQTQQTRTATEVEAALEVQPD